MGKIVMLGLVGVLLAIQFKSGKQEYGIYIGIAISLIIFFYVCEYLEQVKGTIQSLGSLIEDKGEYIGILMKVTGIAYLSEFGASLCRDAGFQAVASQIELFGKVTVLLAGMPVVMALADMITGFMK